MAVNRAKPNPPLRRQQVLKSDALNVMKTSYTERLAELSALRERAECAEAELARVKKALKEMCEAKGCVASMRRSMRCSRI